ncbi:hypothetical protein BKA69DRAFT_1072821 [Paraphysoderma sedebokerense]|nr:hypothetical protein BKA69DRAFT_1072821 [Paraphysoderma sedebokerense]
MQFAPLLINTILVRTNSGSTLSTSALADDCLIRTHALAHSTIYKAQPSSHVSPSHANPPYILYSNALKPTTCQTGHYLL